MKKLISLAILGAFLMLAPAQTVQAAVGDTLLTLGATGSDVVQLQTELNYLGYNVGIVDGIFGNAIIATSKKYIGIPYLWGGTSPETGFDCSGYVQYVFAKNGISLPRVSRDQYTVGTPVAFNNLQPGDLVFFSIAKNGIVDHDGIYIGNGQFINSSSSKGVTIYNLGPYWQSVYVGAKRVF